MLAVHLTDENILKLVFRQSTGGEKVSMFPHTHTWKGDYSCLVVHFVAIFATVFLIPNRDVNSANLNVDATFLQTKLPEFRIWNANFGSEFPKLGYGLQARCVLCMLILHPKYAIDLVCKF